MINNSSISSQFYSYVSLVGELMNLEFDSINKQKYEHKIKDFFKLKCFLQALEFQDLINALEELTNLPEILPLLPDSKQIEIFFEKAKLTHKAKIAWLKNKLFDTPLPTDLLKSKRGYYPAAQSYANLQLAQKTFPWSDRLRILFPSVEIFWVCCEFSTSLAQFRIIGLTDNPAVFPKTYTLNFLAKFTDYLEGYKEINGLNEWRKFVNKSAIKSFRSTEKRENIADLLFTEAYNLYKVDRHNPDNWLHKQFVKKTLTMITRRSTRNIGNLYDA